MPLRHITSVLVLLGFGLTMLPCPAQNDGKVEVRFICFPPSSDTDPVELVTGDQKVIKVDLPSNSVSDAYVIEKPSKWVLGKAGIGPDNKATFKVYGEASALASKKQLILVTRKGLTNDEGLTMTPFASDPGGFGGGQYLFYNAAKVDIACKLGATKFSIKPKQHKLLSPKPSTVQNDRKYLFTYLYYRVGDTSRPFYESTWRFSDKARCMVFIYHDPHTKQLRTHSIRNFVW